MKGRPEDWQASLADVPLRALLDGAAASGFGGVHLDRRLFPDGGRALEGELGRELGPPAISSADGNLLFYDLRPRAGQIPAAMRPAMKAATVTPVQIGYDESIYYSEGSGDDRWRWADDHASIVFENPSSATRRLVLDVLLRTDATKAGRTTLTFPDGSPRSVGITGEGTRVTRKFDVPPGESRLRFDTEGTPAPVSPGDQRRLFVQLRRLTLVPEELCGRAPDAGRKLLPCVRGPRPQLR